MTILFNIILNNEVVNKIERSDRGINIDGEYLFYLLYINKLDLLPHSVKKLQSMSKDISEESNKIGLSPNTDEKIMTNEFTQNTKMIKSKK